MTYGENIRAILECCFAGFKEELIDSACNRILEQEPCEDCISKEELVKYICENRCDYYDCNYNSVDSYTKKPRHETCPKSDWVYELPSVTPTRKKGKWIDLDVHVGMIHTVRCNQCNKPNGYGTEYCPHCGADMRESEEE